MRNLADDDKAQTILCDCLEPPKLPRRSGNTIKPFWNLRQSDLQLTYLSDLVERSNDWFFEPKRKKLTTEKEFKYFKVF